MAGLDEDVVFIATSVTRPDLGYLYIKQIRRSVRVSSVLGSGIGFLGGFLVGILPAVIFGTLLLAVYAGMVGAVIGYLSANWSPQPGENLFVWGYRALAKRRANVVLDGHRCRVYYGTTLVAPSTFRPQRIQADTIEIRPGKANDLGYLND